MADPAIRNVPMLAPVTIDRLPAPDEAVPTRLGIVLFSAKVFVFRAWRLAFDLIRGPARLPRLAEGLPHVVAESRTVFWSDNRPEERTMQLGKVQNLRVAARRLDRTVIPNGAIFSFWKQLGPPSRFAGFVGGRMLQEGCMVKSTGGGLCQLSNALYDVALTAGCEIVERHAHSRTVPNSSAAFGRDATVAWNYVDLRFRARENMQLRVQVERDLLVVRLMGTDRHADVGPHSDADEFFFPRETCATCGKTSCFRHESPKAAARECAAFLVDEAWPEFVDFFERECRPEDVLGIPLNGARWGLCRYRWPVSGFAHVVEVPDVTIARSIASRWFAQQGPARRRAELRTSEALSRRYAKLLDAHVTDIVVAQSLLPFLWRDGHLGGRRFRVFMTRLPLRILQDRLDKAARIHPERATLSDFRAPPEIVASEAEALAAADAIVSPHAEIRELFPERAIALEWKVSSSAQRMTPPGIPLRIAFPGPTVARKGAYELRDAAKILDAEIVPLGSELEGPDFWSGVRVSKPDPSDWLAGVSAVVQPALVEEQPRKLLEALARGVPVIATAACGLSPQPGLFIVDSVDPAALARAIHTACQMAMPPKKIMRSAT